MQFAVNHASLPEILDYAPELRREAYVDAALRMQADDNIVGIFGSAYSAAHSPIIDEVLIYAYGLIPVPIVGVDSFIFAHGEYPACDALKSTMIYLTTQKCPLLYSSKMYVLDGTCPSAETAFRHCTQKPVYVCGIDSAENLKSVLSHVYGRTYSPSAHNTAKAAFAVLEQLLAQLAQSNLSGNDFGMLAFYSRFIFELEERIQFLKRVCSLAATSSAGIPQTNEQPRTRVPVAMHCPDGIIRKVTPAAGSYFKPVQVTGTAAIACAGCIYEAAQYTAY